MNPYYYTDGNRVWSDWAGNTYANCTTTSSATTSGNVWYSWTSTAGDTSATSTGAWATWTSSSTSSAGGYVVYGSPTIKETEAQRKERERENAKAEKEEAERRKAAQAKKDAANKKAKELLEEVLDDDQRAELNSKDEFTLRVVGSGNRYRIKKGDCRNIEKLDATGKVVENLCFHPRMNAGQIPHYDTMAIQKLMLENYEDEARKVANISRYS